MKPRVAFFEFASCEGCQLEALNLTPEEMQDLVTAVDIVNFREAMSEKSENFDIAFVEGSITRASDIPRIKKIREQSRVLVAFGACAVMGGVNCLKNSMPVKEAVNIVYGENAENFDTIKDTIKAMPLDAVVPVDYYIPGCPPSNMELLKVLKALLLGKKPEIPSYPVCVECKMSGNVCAFERAMQCLGPVTRAGCDAICIKSGRYCWGCRGLVDEANLESQKQVLAKHGLTTEEIQEKFKMYNTCSEIKI